MTNKSLLAIFGGLLFVILIGLFFVYKVVFSENNLEDDNHSDVASDYQDSKKSSNNSGSVQGENSKSGGESHTSNAFSNPKTSVDNGLVVDQSMSSSSGIRGKAPEIKAAVVGKSTNPDAIDVDILVFDGQENKPIKNSDFQVQSQFIDGRLSTFVYQADSEGKIKFKADQVGLCRLLFTHKEYAPQSKIFNVLLGKNSTKVFFYKGGTLQIKAVNQEGKTLDGLNARLLNGFVSPDSADIVALEKDIGKGVFFYYNVPVGANEISFRAAGYLETDVYKINIESQKTSELEVRLMPARKIFFDIEAKQKPDMILISNLKKVKGTLPGMAGVNARLPNRGNNSIKQVDNANSVSKEKSEAFKNQSGLYEFELAERNVVSLTVEVNGYVPIEVQISNERDTYKITLKEGFAGKVQVNDEKGQGLAGAMVTCTSGIMNQSFVTNEKGLAEITGLNERMQIKVNVILKNYGAGNVTWNYNKGDNSTIIVTLKAGKSVTGVVKSEDKLVAGAKVTLVVAAGEKSKPNEATVLKTVSAGDGSFVFESLGDKFKGDLKISAYHKDFGNASSGSQNIEGKGLQLDLILVKEKNLELLVVDHKGKPLAEKNVTILNTLEPEFSLSVMTDANGKYEGHNLKHGAYIIRLADSKYRSNDLALNIPSGPVVLTAKSKDLKKVNVTLAKGGAFNGNMSVLLERNDWPIDVVHDEDGYFVELHEGEPIVFVIFVFRAQGYADVRMGPYNSAKELPDEFNIEFREGENFKVKVVDDFTNSPVPFVTVSVTAGNTLIESLPTNDFGEINFVHVSGKFLITINADGFSPYSGEFDGSSTKTSEVRLLKGGILQGHLTPNAKYNRSSVILKPGDFSQNIDDKGNFEFLNLTPGEYSLTLARMTKEGKLQSEKIPARIIIERNKTFDINLDEFQKNQTTLDVSVLKDGSPSTERGVLNITDRRGQSVISAEVTTGQYTVERILPGEYLLNYNYQGRLLQKSIEIIPMQANVVEIYVPGSVISFSVKNSNNTPISKIMITAYTGEKYRIEDTYLGNQILADPRGNGTFNLMPKTPYYFLIEEDFRFNYKVEIYGPVILEAGQSSHVDYILPYGRKLPKLLVTDNNNKPLPDVGFLFNDENGVFYQRTLLKEWDFYPYSNVEGFLPENCWPISSFNLVVGKEGFEFKSVLIPAEFDANQVFQIKLNPGTALTCNFPQKLPIPISVGILNKDGELLQKPISYPSRKKKDLSVYYENITSGNVTFLDLAPGVYFVGYFWNGSSRLISKQGPFTVEAGKIFVATSDLKLEGF